jgi:phage-related protein
MEPNEKDLVWLRGEVKSPPFSSEARFETGVLLRKLQRGDRIPMPHSRPMPSIGSGCHELRVRDRSGTWRIVYAIDPDAVLVLDVFEKKTKATPDGIVQGCRRRLRAYRAMSRGSDAR